MGACVQESVKQCHVNSPTEGSVAYLGTAYKTIDDRGLLLLLRVGRRESRKLSGQAGGASGGARSRRPGRPELIWREEEP